MTALLACPCQRREDIVTTGEPSIKGSLQNTNLQCSLNQIRYMYSTIKFIFHVILNSTRKEISHFCKREHSNALP